MLAWSIVSTVCNASSIMSGDEAEEKLRQISEWLDVYANSTDPFVQAAEEQLSALRALERNNRSPITLLKEHPFLSLAVVSLEGTTLKPFITIVHQSVLSKLTRT